MEEDNKKNRYKTMSDDTAKYLNEMISDIQQTADKESEIDNTHYFISGLNTWVVDVDLFKGLTRYKRDAKARKGTGYANVWLVRCHLKTVYGISDWSGAPIVDDHDAIFIAEIHF